MVVCAVFVVLYSCAISFSAYGNKEVRISNLKRSFCSLQSTVLIYGKSLLFSWTRILKYRPSACIRFRLTSNLFKCTIFSINNIVLVAEAELNIFIFCRV